MTDKKRHEPKNDPDTGMGMPQVDPAEMLDLDPFGDRLADLIQGVERAPEEKAAEIERGRAALRRLGGLRRGADQP